MKERGNKKEDKSGIRLFFWYELSLYKLHSRPILPTQLANKFAVDQHIDNTTDNRCLNHFLIEPGYSSAGGNIKKK